MDIFYPIQLFADLITYQLLSLTHQSYLASSINFFVYDVIKIGILLIIINYLMAVVRYYFPMGKLNQILTSRKWYGLDYLLAALLGVIAPAKQIPMFC